MLRRSINSGGNYGRTGDFGFDVCNGDYPGLDVILKFGVNPDIDTASGYEDIWNGGDSYTGFNATSAETLEIFSSSADDTEFGTGARTLEVINALDANWERQTEIVTLQGTTPVDTGIPYIRGARYKVKTAGSGEVNAGTITVRQKTTTANVFAQLPIGESQTLIACDTIPAGKTGWMAAWFATLAGRTNANSVVKLYARPENEVFQIKEVISLQGNGTTALRRKFEPLYKGPFAAKTDIKVRADSSVNNTGVAAGFDLILVDD